MSSWEKLAAQGHEESLAYRDVYNDQQLDRAERQYARSKRPAIITGWVVGGVVALLLWIFYSMLALGLYAVSEVISGDRFEVQPYYSEGSVVLDDGSMVDCYRPVDEAGDKIEDSECVLDLDELEVPGWYQEASEQAEAARAAHEAEAPTLGSMLFSVSFFKMLVAFGGGAVAGLTIGGLLNRQVAKHNAQVDHSDINDNRNDQHIALPEEVVREFDWFPDAGAHSGVQVTSVLSHVMLNKKGLGNVEVHVHDKEGEALYDDETGEPVIASLPWIDTEFGEDLFEASGLPADKRLRRRFDATTIPYNPDGKNRDKLGTYATVADLIKDDWEFPDYEVQRPAGAYIVDTAPVNTMVLAITRAGKGQTYIEPTIDMWSREKEPSNMTINDPKGELLVKNYVPLVTRGFEVNQFNLINSMKTDIYNPLGMAAEAARAGDAMKCALYVEGIADTFFPTDGGDDPVWANAANNAFKRACYGMIDYYLEEEHQLREQAVSTGMDPGILVQKLDDMWGKVTLYNCYQLFVQLTSKKMKNPTEDLEKRKKAGEFDDDEETYEQLLAEVERKKVLWEDKPEQDMLTLFFNASEALPTNTIRRLISNAHNSLKSMAGAEKMLASVYGIAITAMSFFTDPTISTLTSGKPSQNVDLGGLSFPRRIGVRFNADYFKREHFIGLQVRWSAYSDPMFSQSLGKDFEHSDIASREAWAYYYFKGIFPTDEAWLRLELVNVETNMLVRTFYFHFKKGYQLTLNGRRYVVEPVTNRKVVKDGVLREMRPVRAGGTLDGAIESYEFSETTFAHRKLNYDHGNAPTLVDYREQAIEQTMVRYSESPKAIFLVTPPHLMKYAKLLLILLKQLVDLNFDKSYMTKSNQKPLYRTRFMLDELGNLQSDGHGISGFETMLSIGLGQEQQFTIILQTMQQLRDVYGESVDKIVQGNAQPLDARIATPTGWRTMGEMAVGTEVLTPTGGSTQVTGVHPQGTRAVYEVRTDDGGAVRACDEHLWQVELTAEQHAWLEDYRAGL